MLMTKARKKTFATGAVEFLHRGYSERNQKMLALLEEA
jgi:hypothetical protein